MVPPFLRTVVIRFSAALRAVFFDTDGHLDVQQLLFAAALILVGIGAREVYRPAGYLAPGTILLWWTLPSRPPFVTGPPSSKRRADQ